MRSNPRVSKASYALQARVRMAKKYERDAIWKEHDRIVPAATEVVSQLDPAARALVEGYEQEFFDGKPEPFISWARANIPGSFPVRTAKPANVSKLTPQRIVPVQSLGSLPNRLYHGSRNVDAVLVEGFVLPPAKTIWNDAYAWEDLREFDSEEDREDADTIIEWASYVYDWYEDLTAKGQALLREQLKLPSKGTKYKLGGAISLLWTFDHPTTSWSERDSWSGKLIQLEIDPRKLPLLGFFGADEAGKGETVLILPSGGWQGGPDAITGVWEHPR